MEKEQAGALLIDKHSGPTSSDIVVSIRKKYRIKRVGHGGTLDPMATGLLVVLIGKATRLQDILMEGKKSYEGLIRLGISTDTDDVTGKIISQVDVRFNSLEKQEIESRLEKKFLGEIDQVPPQFSALKVGGKKSYELARKGKVVELSSRRIEIYKSSFSFISDNLLSYKIVCSKGTYIRSIARDCGVLLGCGGSLETIRRNASGPFFVDDAEYATELTELIEDNSCWRDMTSLVSGMPTVEVEDAERVLLQNGNKQAVERVSELIKLTFAKENPLYVVVSSPEKIPILVLELNGNQIGYRIRCMLSSLL